MLKYSFLPVFILSAISVLAITRDVTAKVVTLSRVIRVSLFLLAVLIKALNKNQTITVIGVTHDINLASSYCDRLILMRSGFIHCLGSPDEVIAESHIREVYETNVTVDRNPVTGQPRVTLMSSHPSEGGSRSNSGAAPQL